MACCHAVRCKNEPKEKAYVRIPYFPYKAYYCAEHSKILSDLREKGLCFFSVEESIKIENKNRGILDAMLK